jgi:hypothetical protein
MKALSIRQPWANLIAAGHKTIETRTWSTKYRSELLICASKTVDVPAAKLLAVLSPTIKINPAGMALCVADLVDCRPMRVSDEQAARCPTYEGAFAWVLNNIRPIKPFPVKGQLGLFSVEMPEGF